MTIVVLVVLLGLVIFGLVEITENQEFQGYINEDWNLDKNTFITIVALFLTLISIGISLLMVKMMSKFLFDSNLRICFKEEG